jgi:hypothetical protein
MSPAAHCAAPTALGCAEHRELWRRFALDHADGAGDLVESGGRATALQKFSAERLSLRRMTARVRHVRRVLLPLDRLAVATQLNCGC